MAEHPKDGKSSLSEAAHAMREGRGRAAPGRERTTLRIHAEGAQPEQAADMAHPDALGEALVDRGLITRHQLFNALNESYRTGSTLREALLALHYVTEDVLEREGL